jgi:hypothetical protein
MLLIFRDGIVVLINMFYKLRSLIDIFMDCCAHFLLIGWNRFPNGLQIKSDHPILETNIHDQPPPIT